MAEIPTVKLNNGVEMPAFGLGTWQGSPGHETEVRQAVKDAIDLGYRLFDCAHAYGNEKAVGDAIQEKIKEGVVERKDLFITSKLWCNSHRQDLVEPALRTSLKNLRLDQLDLCLIQWPMAFLETEEVHPSGGHHYSDVDYLKTWKAMEAVYRQNLTRAVGVSNFNGKQLERILNFCTVFPQVNQVECHPYLNQAKMRKFCDNHGIYIMAYSPLGGRRIEKTPESKEGTIISNVLGDSTIEQIARRYDKSPAQILIRYNLQLGNIVIPKSSNKKRLEENVNVFNFVLAPEDMSLINSLDCNQRVVTFAEVKDHVYYPFQDNVEF